MAQKAEANIVPVTFQGLHRLTKGLFWHPGTLLITQGTVVMKIGKPILKERVTSEPVLTIMDEVRTQMKQMMRPPLPDSVVFTSNMSYLPWLYFIIIHAIAIIVLFRL